MGGGYVVWRWEEGCVRKGCELCTCGLGRGVHVCRKGYECVLHMCSVVGCDDINVFMCGVSCVHVYRKGGVYMCIVCGMCIRRGVV